MSDGDMFVQWSINKKIVVNFDKDNCVDPNQGQFVVRILDAAFLIFKKDLLILSCIFKSLSCPNVL